MKLTLFILSCMLLIFSIPSCNSVSQNEASKQDALIKETVKKNSPGTIATSPQGHYMEARIDGKHWSASYMMPETDANSSYKLIHGENGADFINFQLWRDGIKAGEKISFSESNVANLSLARFPDDYFGGSSGEIEITKMNGQWLEGTFHFTAHSSNTGKMIEVSDGRFRGAIVPGLQ